VPVRPGKACRVNHCPIIVLDHSHRGYCLEHQDKAGWNGNEKDKGTAEQRGYGAQWRKLRQVVLSRDKHLCQSCLLRGQAITGTHCDHIKPKSKGGDDSLMNLQILCQRCHNIKTGSE
jgi:5-methylcytosine-specific restriction protein A